jgi:hypothetical protein
MPKEHKINGYDITDYNNIFVIENILDVSMCNQFIELIHAIPTVKVLYGPNNNVQCHNALLDEYINIDDTLYYEFSVNDEKYDELLKKIEDNNIYTNKLNGYSKEDMKKYIVLLDEKTDIIKHIIGNINKNICFDFNTGYNLRKIFGKTRLHADGLFLDKQFNLIHINKHHENRTINMNTTIVRNATAIFALNDDYEGGEFVFPYENTTIKLKQGSVIIFPPYWTHSHETNELLNNTYRYTINTWYGEILYAREKSKT